MIDTKEQTSTANNTPGLCRTLYFERRGSMLSQLSYRGGERCSTPYLPTRCSTSGRELTGTPTPRASPTHWSCSDPQRQYALDSSFWFHDQTTQASHQWFPRGILVRPQWAAPQSWRVHSRHVYGRKRFPRRLEQAAHTQKPNSSHS